MTTIKGAVEPHCFPPDIGQGVNSALEDVSVLNDILCQTQDDLTQALPLYEAKRAMDVNAVVRLAQTAAPWQYNQNRWRGRLWAMQFFLRLGISRLIPTVNPPAFFLLQNYQLSYHPHSALQNVVLYATRLLSDTSK